MNLWVTYGRTESGDDLTPLVWDYEPTSEQVDAVYRAQLPDEYEEVGFVCHTTERAEKMWL